MYCAYACVHKHTPDEKLQREETEFELHTAVIPTATALQRCFGWRGQKAKAKNWNKIYSD